jgi:hypothetical protein
VYSGEIGDKREKRLKNLELNVDALRHAVVHSLDNRWDSGEGNCTESNKALEGAEGYRDHFSVFGSATHEDRAKEVVCVPAICCNEREEGNC